MWSGLTARTSSPQNAERPSSATFVIILDLRNLTLKSDQSLSSNNSYSCTCRRRTRCKLLNAVISIRSSESTRRMECEKYSSCRTSAQLLLLHSSILLAETLAVADVQNHRHGISIASSNNFFAMLIQRRAQPWRTCATVGAWTSSSVVLG